MKRMVPTIVVMLALLMSQISGSFASSMRFSNTSDMSCDMHIANSSESLTVTVSDAMSMSHDAHQMAHQEHISQDATNMDCCDNHDMSECADGFCDCIAVSLAATFVACPLNSLTMLSEANTYMDYSSQLHAAYSALLIRPPIQLT